VSGDTVTPGKPRRNSQASGGGRASDAGVLFVDHAAADPDRVREPARALEAAALERCARRAASRVSQGACDGFVTVAAGAAAPQPAAPRDAQHDFDWDIGAWVVHSRRLLHPLTGSTTWVEYQGTDVVRNIWGGRANIGEVELDGSTGHLEYLTLRLYNPQTGDWSMNISSSATGTLGPPAIGRFAGAHGEFLDREDYQGRSILVRFEVSVITPSACRFEQSFSADGGKTWELNLIVDETRVGNAPPVALAR